MPNPVHVDQVLTVTPTEGADIETIRKRLNELRKAHLVKSIGSINVTHVDSLAKSVIKLLDIKSIIQLLQGGITIMRDEKNIEDLTKTLKGAEQALDEAFESSSSSLATVKEIRQDLAQANRVGQEAIRRADKVLQWAKIWP